MTSAEEWNSRFPTVGKRLFLHVLETPRGCLEWQKHIRPGGYGRIGVGKRAEDTHRVAWKVAHGHIPDGLFVLHNCDNPPCVNIDHLFLGTKADKGFTSGVRGVSNKSAKLTKSQVDEIRSRFDPATRYQRNAGPNSRRGLAQEFGITGQYIGQLIRGQWRKSE